MARVRFRIGDVIIDSEWNDSPTAQKILSVLPIRSHGSYWGKEFYFDIPVIADLEEGATDVVEPGTVAYWPPGNSLCLFWGPTPASRGSECRAASAVNVVGRVINVEDLEKLRARQVTVELVTEP